MTVAVEAPLDRRAENPSEGFTRTGRLYVWAVIASGTVAVTHAVYVGVIVGWGAAWWLFAGLTVCAAWLTLRMSAVPVSFSIADTFTSATAILFGPDAATVVVVLDAAVISARLSTIRSAPRRLLFNMTGPSLAMAVSARLFFAMAQTGPLVGAPGRITEHVYALLAFAAAYFVFNTALVARAVAFERQERFARVWLEHFAPLWLTYFGGATTGGLIILLAYSTHLNLPVLVLLAPLPFTIYAAFSAGLGRTRDHIEHLNTVNALHLATIETLAQAIDARDQVTHDHIRRVQLYAMRLADELHVTDQADRRALEAASLLHDMGKIAVPEHILNKPGKLTRSEFDQMKLHATVGADILSPIDFPFPVVPIVRHHHENWDGSGYPAGLHGNDIPLGARILSVVDCFDALTSDRPYRARLSSEEAVRMIVARAGQMYDPAVVEAFVRIAPTLPSDTSAASSPPALQMIAETSRSGAFPAYRPDRPPDKDVIAQAVLLGKQVGAAETLSGALRDIQVCFEHPCDGTLVFLAHERECGRLAARCVAGPHASALARLTMMVGTRLSGWVAAQRRSIVNSDALLDVRESVDPLAVPPSYCVSAPMTDGDELVGVLSMYSHGNRAFPVHQALLLETAAALLTPLAVRTAPSVDDGATESSVDARTYMRARAR